MFIKRALPEADLAWIVLAILATVDGFYLLASGMSLKLVPCLFVGGSVLTLLLLAQIYTKLRPDARLSLLALTGAQLLIYTAVAGILSYLLAANSDPPIDSWLVAVDRWLGLDWPTMYGWVKAHIFTHLSMIIVYYSLVPQFILLQIFLFTTQRLNRGRELFWLFMLTSLVSVIISGLLPAEGAFVTFDIEKNDPYVRQLLALRDGSMRGIDLQHMQGIVQFPSFHLALAVVLIYAARNISILFPVLLIWNAFVIVATPFVGGHHFADLLGGAVLTTATIMLMRQWQARGFISVKNAI